MAIKGKFTKPVSAAPVSKDQSDKLAKKVEVLRIERSKLLAQKRLELARLGNLDFEQRRYAEAVKNFVNFLRVVEELKNVKEGGLTPELFDVKTEMSDLLMVSGVFWNLAKLFDQTQTEEKKADFDHFLRKFVLFSQKMPFEKRSAETIRRHLYAGKTIHKKEFQEAYRVLNGNRCFIASSLVGVIAWQTMPRLQRIRDKVFKKSKWGQAFLWLYATCSPYLAYWIPYWPESLQRILAGWIDGLSKILTRWLYGQKSKRLL